MSWVITDDAWRILPELRKAGLRDGEVRLCVGL